MPYYNFLYTKNYFYNLLVVVFALPYNHEQVVRCLKMRFFCAGFLWFLDWLLKHQKKAK